MGGWVGCRLIAAAARRLDVSLASFLTSLVNIVLKVLLLITVAGMIGFETTSFVALLGAAGLAVGLALQGTLANFAGGVLYEWRMNNDGTFHFDYASPKYCSATPAASPKYC